MYTLIKCSDAYLKTLGSLWQYYRYEPALEDKKIISGAYWKTSRRLWQYYRYEPALEDNMNCWFFC